MSPSLPTAAFLYILNIFLSPTLPKFPFFHNCHATPKGHGLQPPQNSERALSLLKEKHKRYGNYTENPEQRKSWNNDKRAPLFLSEKPNRSSSSNNNNYNKSKKSTKS